MSENYAYLAPLPGFGGLEMEIVRNARNAIERGKNAVVITLIDSGIFDFCRQSDVEVRTINPKVPYISLGSAYKLSKIFIEKEINICVVGKTEFIAIAILAKKISGRKITLVLYQQMISGLNKKDFFHNWEYRNLDAVITLAEYMRKDLSKTTVFPYEKSIAIPVGRDLDKFNPGNKSVDIRRKYSVPNGKIVFGCVGRIEPLKGFDTAIRAYAEASVENSCLIIAGNVTNEEFYRELKKIISDLHLEVSVHFKPFTLDVHEMMGCFDIFILPSLCETFGFVNIEAMATGLPVLGTSCGGVPEIVQDNRNGFLFTQHDYIELSRLMKKLAEDSELRIRLGRQARADAEERYDNRKQYEKFFQYCEKHKSK